MTLYDVANSISSFTTVLVLRSVTTIDLRGNTVTVHRKTAITEVIPFLIQDITPSPWLLKTMAVAKIQLHIVTM